MPSQISSTDTDLSAPRIFPAQLPPEPVRLSRWRGVAQRAVTAVVYIAIFSLSFAVAGGLRFDFDPPEWLVESMWRALPIVLAVKLAWFALARQLRAWWGHISFRDLHAIVLAATASSLCLLLLNAFRILPQYVPRTILVLDWAATVLLISGIRSLWRWITETALPLVRQQRYRRALLVAASPSDKILALNLQAHPQLPFRIRGFLDAHGLDVGRSIAGVPVLGQIGDLAELAQKYRVNDVIVVTGSLRGRELHALRRACDAHALQLHLLPPLRDLSSRQPQLPLRRVEPDKLLRRPSVTLDDEPVETLLRDACVLITGAGGSIGSEICRQLLKFEPATLVLVDRSEPSLYHIEMELRRAETNVRIEACLADSSDEKRMASLLKQYQPSLVFHVAAHKHVPLLEAHAGEAVKNNSCGTAMLAELCERRGVARFVYISTDKAVKPSSIMGVTKRIAEQYVLSLNASSVKTRYMVVRFGNVLGSAGSVVPLFQEQILRGGPITITHPAMQRYFMTISEAARLVLQAGAVGRGGEIFVLDMGDPVAIIDLARDMIRMTGLPEHSIELEFVGMRPGEKLYEELYFDDERPTPTGHPKLNAALHDPLPLGQMRERIDELRLLADGDPQVLIERLREFVPDYCPPRELTPPAAGVPALVRN